MTSVTVTILAVLLVIGGALAAVTRVGASRIEARFPPLGRFVTTSAGLMHVVDRGPRTDVAILLLHGASGNLRDLDETLGTRLSDTFRVIAVDRPGHGHSERREGTDWAEPEAQARAIAEALDALGVQRTLVVGHSLGAAIAMATALVDKPRTAGLVLITPATHPWGGGGISWHNHLAARDGVGTLFTALLPLPVGRLVMPKALDEVFRPDDVPADYADRMGAALVLRPSSFRANAEDVTRLLDNVARLAPRYSTVDVPAVVIDGRHDPIVWNHVHADGLMRDLARARRVTLETGHMPHWTATEAILAEVRAAADEILSAPTAAGS